MKKLVLAQVDGYMYPGYMATVLLKNKFAAFMAKDWNVRQTCLKLGISRKTGYKWIGLLKLRKPKRRK